MAAVYNNYCLAALNIGTFSCAGDPTIFKNSDFTRRLERSLILISEKRYLPDDINGTAIAYVFVADEAFSLSEHVLRKKIFDKYEINIFVTIACQKPAEW